MKTTDTAGSQVEQLFKKNEEYMERFDKHRLFVLVRNGLLKDPVARRKFLDCFQVWSNYFQKMVLNRVVTLQNPAFEELAWAHLSEELGHNRDLAKSRPDLQTVFDPVLEGVCSWFASKVGVISDIEKVVLVHLVVEASAVFFYKHVQPAMATHNTKGHFEKHKSDDEAHVQMGYDFLRKVTSADWPRLFDIQRQGWSMLMAVMGRVADLVVHTLGQLDTSEEQQDAQHVAEPIAARAKSSERSPFIVEPVGGPIEPRAKSGVSSQETERVVEEQGTAAE